MEKISSTLLIAAHKRDHKKFLSKLTDPSSQDIKELQEYALRKNILESYVGSITLLVFTFCCNRDTIAVEQSSSGSSD